MDEFDEDVKLIEKESKAFLKENFEQYQKEIIKKVIQVFNQNKKKLETVQVLHDDKTIRVKPFRIPLNLKYKVVTTDKYVVNVQLDVVPISGMAVEMDVLQAQWSGTQRGLSQEILNYLKAKVGLDVSKHKPPNSIYYFHPSSAHLQWKYKTDRALDKIT